MVLKIKKIIPKEIFNIYHFLLALFSAILFRFPSFNKKIKVIGITGTNGKSTTAEMIAEILKNSGFKIALLSSIHFLIGEQKINNELRMTMPGRFFVQKFLRKAVNCGCQFAILEVTSEGIKQYRHKFIKFDSAVFLNLFPEHIESHGSFEKYRKAKLELFKVTKKTHIINIDDENAKYFLEIHSQKKYLFGFKKESQKCKIETQEKNLKKELEFNLSLKIPGDFNIYNAMAAICVGLEYGVKIEDSLKILKSFKGVPGRMEEVISDPFKVIVDYAFTPIALEKVYQTLTSQLTTKNSRLICVLGSAGGGRDKWKRPVLGEIAAKYCQEIIITNEDPYDEDPWQIIEQVAKGAGKKAKKILDRREAIRESLKLAQSGDVVVITGKGCEPSICVAKGKKIPWDDRKVAREEFESLR
ncbi:MAG: Mur ligase family protein [Minisyncoccia bacterium]